MQGADLPGGEYAPREGCNRVTLSLQSNTEQLSTVSSIQNPSGYLIYFYEVPLGTMKLQNQAAPRESDCELFINSYPPYPRAFGNDGTPLLTNAIRHLFPKEEAK